MIHEVHEGPRRKSCLASLSLFVCLSALSGRFIPLILSTKSTKGREGRVVSLPCLSSCVLVPLVDDSYYCFCPRSSRRYTKRKTLVLHRVLGGLNTANRQPSTDEACGYVSGFLLVSSRQLLTMSVISARVDGFLMVCR